MNMDIIEEKPHPLVKRLVDNGIAFFNNNTQKEYKGINEKEYRILAMLASMTDRTAQLKIVRERVNIAKPDMSRIVTRLMLKGLITKEASADNPRMVDLSLSQEGINTIRNLRMALIHSTDKIIKKCKMELKEIE